MKPFRRISVSDRSIAGGRLAARLPAAWCAVVLLPAVVLSAVVLPLAVLPNVASGQTNGTWTSTTGGSWDTASNWLGNNIADGTGAVADFSTLNITGVQTVTLDAPRTSGTLLFGDTASANGGWTLTSSTLTLATASGVPTISVTGLGSATVFGNQAATISSVLAGSNGLTKTGSSALVLSAANTYSGATTVSGGFLVLTNASALGNSSSVTVSSGALAIGNGVTIGSGKSLTNNSAGNSYGGLTAISGGTGTWAGSYSGLGRIGYENNSVLVVSGSLGGSSNLVFSGLDAAASRTAINTQYAVIVTGTNNGYTGQTQVARGVLKIGADNALPTVTTLDIRTSGVNASEAAGFDLNGFNQTVGVLSSSGITAGSGAVTANGSAFLTNSSLTTGTFTANQNSNTTFRGMITGNLAFTKAGAGNLTLEPTLVTAAATGTTGTSTFSGRTLVTAGTLTLGNANALFGSTVDTDGAGTLSTGGLSAATFGALTGTSGFSLTRNSAPFTLSLGGNNVSSTYAATLSGSGGITKVGSGTLALSGTNTYEGTTTVSAGTLLISNTAAIPGIVTGGRYFVAAGATLATSTEFDDTTLQAMVGTGNFAANGVLGVDTAAGNRTFSNSLTGTVGLEIAGGNGLTLSASNTLGPITLTSSTLTLSSINALGGSGTVTVNGGTVEWTPGAGTAYAFNGRSIVVTGSGATFRNNTPGGDQLQFGNLSGTGAVVFAAGSAQGLIATNGNSYSGGTTIKPGAMIAYTADNGFGTGPVTIEGGSLRSSQGAPRTLSVPVSLSGDVTFNASGSSVDNNLVFTGPMTITGATRTVNVEMSPRPDATGIFFNGPIGDGGSVLGLVKSGTSMLILGGANTYSGTTTLAAGTLRLANASALGGGGSLSFTGGTLQYTGSNTADYASRIKGSIGAIRIEPNGQSITYAGSIDSTNSGGLRLGGSGTLVLSGSNGFTGPTQLAAGVLALANADALAGSGTVAFNGGSVQYRLGAAGTDISGKIRGSNSAILIDTNGENVTFAGAINNTNTAGLTKSGAGTLTLSGANSYGGTTTVTAGTLAFTTDAALASLTGPVALDAATLAYTGTSVLNQTVDRPISLGAGGGTLTNQGLAFWFMNGQITGAGPLTVASGSTLIVMTGANTNSGGVTLAAGSQVVVANNSVGPAGAPTSGVFGTGMLTFAGGGLRSTTGAGRTVGNAIVATADTTFFSAGTNDDKSITFEGPMTLAGGTRTFTVNTTGTGSPAITFSGAIGDGGNALGLTKAGPGRMILAGTSSYTGVTAVSAGRLAVDGSIAASSGVSVSAGAILGGSGIVAALAGEGLVAPGNSPGILTSPSATLSDGLDFAFEFTQAGAPTWNSATASGNDVLRLTDATTPLVGSATGGNVFNIYFLGTGQTYLGGLFTDLNGSFESLIAGAAFNYFVRDAGGAITYEGFTYSALESGNVTRSTVEVASADFADGTVLGGYTMQFAVVPEPTAGLLTLLGLGGIAVSAACRGRSPRRRPTV
jgi:fibronectin-binding autotransporter adhesin